MIAIRCLQNRARAACLVGVLALAAVASGAAGPDLSRAAATLVGDLGARAIAIGNQSGLAEPERQHQRERLFIEQFDVPGIARFALGRYWRTTTADQQTEYLRLFEAMVVQTYAHRFADAAGAVFTVIGDRLESDDVALVETGIRRPGGGEPTRVAWRVQQSARGLKVIDVIVEGVSMITTEQQDFSAVIQRHGGSIEALLEAMRRQAGRG